MATIEDRRQTISDYVQTHTGRDTFLSDSNFTQPGTRYCTVKDLPLSGYDHDVVTDTDGFNQEVRGLVKIAYSIQAIGGNEGDGTGPVKDLNRLRASFYADLPRQTLEAEGIGIHSIGDVVDTTATVGSRREERALLTIEVSAEVVETFSFDSATEVNMEVDPGFDPAEQLTVPQDPPECPAGG